MNEIICTHLNEAINSGIQMRTTDWKEFDLIKILSVLAYRKFPIGIEYLNRIVTRALSESSDGINLLHLHVPLAVGSIKDALLEYLIWKFFIENLKSSLLSSPRLGIDELRADETLCFLNPAVREDDNVKPDRLFFRIKDVRDDEVVFSPYHHNDLAVHYNLDDSEFLPFISEGIESKISSYRQIAAGLTGKRFNKLLSKERYEEEILRDNYLLLTKILNELARIHKIKGWRLIDLRPDTLFNVYKNQFSRLLQENLPNLWLGSGIDKLLSQKHPHSMMRRPPIIFNDTVTYSEFTGGSASKYQISGTHFFFDWIRSIIIFDKAGRNDVSGFRSSNLEHLNEQGSNFRNLLVFTFEDRRESIYIPSVDRKVKGVNSRYFSLAQEEPLRNGHSITLLPTELRLFTGRDTRPRIKFYSPGAAGEIYRSIREAVWRLYFAYEQEGLRFLNSIALRNILNLCLDEGCKEIILEQLFNNNGGFLTRKRIDIEMEHISEERVDELRRAFTMLLDEIIANSEISEKLHQFNYDGCSAIIPQLYLDENDLASRFKWYRDQLTRIVFFDWSDFHTIESGRLLILDYRDPGPYPFEISPNILQLENTKVDEVVCLINESFFKDNFTTVSQRFTSHLSNNYVTNPKRRWVFNGLEDAHYKKIEDHQKAQRSTRYLPEDLLWDLENAYTYEHEKETVLLELERDYHLLVSDKVLVRDLSHDNYRILRADQLEENDLLNIEVQPLHELFDVLDIYQLSYSDFQELELQKRLKGFDQSTSGERLWKLALLDKAREMGTEALYELLKEYCREFNVAMVSRDWFENDWLNLETETIAPNHKGRLLAIAKVCDLSDRYLRILLKTKARLKQNTSEGRQRMITLLESLLEKGMMENPRKNYPVWHQEYHDQFRFEDYGIDVVDLENDILMVVEQIQNKLTMRLLRGLG